MSKDLTINNSEDFGEILSIIEKARENTFRAVNRELISMYWEIGKYISEKVKAKGWGKSVVSDFANFVQNHYVGIQGFSASNIWRMRQFYEIYFESEKLAPLVREISWTNNLIIMSRAKSAEAREFYLMLAVKNRYSKRELERQIDSMLFERTMLSDEKNKVFIAKSQGLEALRDSYVLEFLDIPHKHKEKVLRKSIVTHLKDFILEFGRDFSFVGEEYRVQVGNKDFFIDLLFYNRELACLVAIELKVGEFRPEHLGQLEFYLEALDSDIKKPNENPSVGLILCTDKDDAVVEYALRRSLSPALVAQYQLHLPNKELLQSKLRELTEIAESEGNDEECPYFLAIYCIDVVLMLK
ncbi:putative nuclease of restriction endonuclease-like (RecB) superfamily [Anaerobacterium chartisolvens]|uniref:Putative nuclease of restriction endonuclease-like (RecB) superfamily n=1 Tax=Anaerobacterium chartisolvens TaxID=1297424 RepID=A0A369BD67_9FIRM|nr:putative nuclease of restriction endonuclease-like (RecB) superfamily [Anaerobacterium chartisolvens]